ncbi:uncharacterized protein [Clytia hemisphaerica]|uniref:uncharacterized protein n=1 Tax=Clytia hemisphaerica TaxID=252671 RepID=UPI0034D6C693
MFIIMIIYFLGTTCLGTLSNAQVIHVSHNENSTYNEKSCGSITEPCFDLDIAISKSQDGDIILLESTFVYWHNKTIGIPHSLSIGSYNRRQNTTQKATISMYNHFDTIHLFQTEASKLVIKNLHFKLNITSTLVLIDTINDSPSTMMMMYNCLLEWKDMAWFVVLDKPSNVNITLIKSSFVAESFSLNQHVQRNEKKEWQRPHDGIIAFKGCLSILSCNITRIQSFDIPTTGGGWLIWATFNLTIKYNHFLNSNIMVRTSASSKLQYIRNHFNGIHLNNQLGVDNNEIKPNEQPILTMIKPYLSNSLVHININKCPYCKVILQNIISINSRISLGMSDDARSLKLKILDSIFTGTNEDSAMMVSQHFEKEPQIKSTFESSDFKPLGKYQLGIYGNEVNIIIKRSIFKKSKGGALFISGTEQVYIVNTTFKDNFLSDDLVFSLNTAAALMLTGA